MKTKLFVFVTFVAVALSAWAKKDSKLPDSYAFTRGIEAYNEEKYDDALDWMEREISDHPDNGYAYIYLSYIKFGKNEYGKSLTALNNALKYLPKKDKEWRSSALGSRGMLQLVLGDTISGLADLSQAIKVDPSNSDLYKERAQVYYEQNNFALADEDYRKMIDLDQGDAVGYIGLGRDANEQGRYDEAIKQYDYALKLAPDFSQCYAFRAKAYAAQEMWAQATDDIVKALDIDGDDTAFAFMKTLPKEAANLLIQKMKIQMAKQPTNEYWPYCLGVVSYTNDDYKEAIAYYKKGFETSGNYLFLENIANCYAQERNFTKALENVEAALAMSPDNSELLEFKAQYLVRLGRYDEGIAQWNSIIEAQPDNVNLYFNRAESFMAARRFDEAIEDLNTVVVLNPEVATNPYLLLKRADALRMTGKAEEAKKEYEATLASEDGTSLSRASVTPFAYLGLGRDDEAIEAMQTVLANDTTDIAGTLYNAACLYSRLGRKEEALSYLQQSIDKGYADSYQMERDYDLDNIKDEPEFQELLLKARTPEENEEAVAVADSTRLRTETVEIPFTKEDGVTKVKCTINGLPLHFVFDTGAADVTMSMVEANFMLKNDYIKPSDIIGSARYMDANGEITEGTVVNLRKVNFGGLELDNVRASIVRNQKAPLLLGQSVLGRLGKIEIDNPGMKLVITHTVSD